MGRLGFQDEWVVEARGEKWRLQVVSGALPRPPSARDLSAIRLPLSALVYSSFDVCGPTNGPLARVLLAIYDRLTGESLSAATEDPMRDERGVLRQMDRELRHVLVRAAEIGRLRVERVQQRPWPFPDNVSDVPVTLPPAPIEAPEPEHFLELQIVSTRGEGVGGIACEVALPSGTILQGVSGADGVLHLRDVDETGTALVTLPDVRPFAPAEARGSPAGRLRIVQDGVNADVDARTVIEIPPQVYRGRLIGMFFEKDKAFLLPSAMHGIRGITRVLEEHEGAQLLVVGHTDTTGAPDYNLKLSVERAEAVAAFLRDGVDTWIDFFGEGKAPEKRWGTRELQMMLSALPEDSEEKFFAAPFTGRNDARTRRAVATFQKARNASNGAGLPETGDIDNSTRAEIVQAYMELEGTSVPEGTVLKTHGCGEFHPAEDLGDGVDDAENRRVEVFVFDDAISPAPVQCLSPGCSQYAQWLDQVVETIDFTTADLEETPLVAGRLPSLCTFGRSFPKPSAIPMLREVVRRMALDRDEHAVIVAHTDHGGDEEKDRAITRTRAAAIAAMLTGDQDFFVQKFTGGAGDDVWGWEELQWMLSAVEVHGDPCYVGTVDGHRGDSTIAAIETFQLFHGLKMNRRADDETIAALVGEYFKLVADAPVDAERVATVAAGSWHVPRSFGERGAPLEGDDFADNRLHAFRRTEVFLSRTALVPPVTACAAGRHERCSAYEAWCRNVREELPDDGLHDFSLRLEDGLARPLGGVPVIITDASDGPVMQGTTSRLGLLRLRLARGVYCVAFHADEEERRASFLLDQDQIGGFTVRIPDAPGDPHSPANAIG